MIATTLKVVIRKDKTKYQKTETLTVIIFLSGK